MDLFDDDLPNEPPEKPVPAAKRAKPAAKARVEPATLADGVRELAGNLPRQLRLGTSSWHFPGWVDLVWDGEHAESTLSKTGLAAYSQHPALRTVSLDRAFYRPLSASQYAVYAAQVPDDFRFLVKAPSLVCDAMVRGENGRGMQPNPAFLDPGLAAVEFIQPVLDGLGAKAGALVFQLSPLPRKLLADMPGVLAALARMLQALPDTKALAPDAVIAVEVRNPEFLTPAFVDVLKSAGATYCLGLHAKMPPIGEQLPLLRALWPGPLVCRWNLHRKHGAFGYEEAKGLYEPFDKLVDPDPDTRGALARVVAATTAAGYNAYVTINNKAEGSAPLSVLELARSVAARQAGR